ncbi:type II secretion system protein D (GspD) [Litorimonas taeanensis]|uniref:Type II secretion system protein D (GspD) n=1 Tax=Litorimonas taeanensis TaxID=568099 RepID=A0A420WMB2_9PROT|nr:secretin N-terminal domain-containing protein [Litorimonas taeanensis]RKQ72130.1 type II secretion system protein D (GspD) [Litorimonas taeanensis]
MRFIKSFATTLLVGASLSALPIGAMSGSTAMAAGDHLITMQQADIRAFIDDVSLVTGRSFIVDPRVQGKVTISSEQSLSKGEVFEVFKDVMRVHGYTVIRTATGEYRVTLLQGAAQDAPFVQGNGVNGSLATTVIKLNYADAAEAARLIKPVMHTQGQVTANPGGNVLVVTDFPENLRKARSIVAAMDQSGTVTETVQLRQLSAIDAEEALKKLGGPKPRVTVVSIPMSNSLIMEGPADEIARLKPIINSMDVGSLAPRGAVSVIPLRYADGTTLVELLATLLPSYTIEGQPAPTVAYETFSNTLVISADGETQRALESIIRRLDVRRPQVLVEAIIVEISDTAAKELGVQFAVGGINGSSVPLISTGFSESPNMLALAGAIAGDEIGLDETTQTSLQAAAISSITGLTGGTIGIGGVEGDSVFSAIVNALEKDENSNILSTPFVTTLDNVPATFLVGQEIPITTGESLGATTVNPFRTFDRIEVGIKLNVLPQISEGDVVRLEIAQEVSSIAGAITSLSQDFVTNKREIETTVLANNKEIIVLGGLVQDDEQITIEKVPVLGDAPLIGELFRNKDKSRVKTNLVVFIRPTIIRNGEDARPLTQERLDQIRREDISQSGRTYSKLDEIIGDDDVIRGYRGE